VILMFHTPVENSQGGHEGKVDNHRSHIMCLYFEVIGRRQAPPLTILVSYIFVCEVFIREIPTFVFLGCTHLLSIFPVLMLWNGVGPAPCQIRRAADQAIRVHRGSLPKQTGPPTRFFLSISDPGYLFQSCR